MRIIATPSFQKSIRRLHPAQKHELDEAIKIIYCNPEAGERKSCELSPIRVYTFRMLNLLSLLAYETSDDTIILYASASHEHFDCELKAKLT